MHDFMFKEEGVTSVLAFFFLLSLQVTKIIAEFTHSSDKIKALEIVVQVSVLFFLSFNFLSS